MSRFARFDTLSAAAAGQEPLSVDYAAAPFSPLSLLPPDIFCRRTPLSDTRLPPY